MQPQTRNNGAIAQLVEQRTENPCVPGSIPGGTTLKKKGNKILISKRNQDFCFLTKRKYNNIDWMTRYTSLGIRNNEHPVLQAQRKFLVVKF